MTQCRWLNGFVASFLAFGCANSSTAAEPDSFPLAAVVSQIKYELAAAQNSSSSGLNLRLEKVDITLSVSRTVDASGKVTIGVPALKVEAGGSGSRKAEELSTLQVELAPPASSITLSTNEVSGLGLAQMIIETRKQLASGINQMPRLEPTKVVISVKFGVTRSGGGTANIKLVVFAIGGGATITTSDAHTVVLTFAKQKAP